MHARPSTVTLAAAPVRAAQLGKRCIYAVALRGSISIRYLLGVALGVVGLVAAVRLWMLKKWSIWPTIIISVLNLLSAAPGIAFAPNAVLQVFSAVGVVVPALIIVLVVLPTSRSALAASS